MCTVSVISVPGGFRLACNRDELLTRPSAKPPELRNVGEREAVMPVDLASGGTWVAVNDAGVAMAMLNVNRNGRGIGGPTSRGKIIPPLLAWCHADEALHAARQVDPRDYPPFRLVVIDGRRWGELLWDGADVESRTLCWDGSPLMFASSGLGDHLVERPRRELFESLPPTPRGQDEFHAHVWPDRPHLSVNMSRGDARTVSRTVIEVREEDDVTLQYVADGVERVVRLAHRSCIQTP